MATEKGGSAFLVAGNDCRVGSVRYLGDAIIASDAIYIFQDRRARLRSFVRPFEIMVDRLLPQKELPGAAYVSIPESVRNNPNWPVRKDSGRPVLIIPRKSVEPLYHPKGSLEVRLIYSGTEVVLHHGRFGGKKIRDFLETTGWPVVWDNQPVNIPQGSPLAEQAKVTQKSFRSPKLSYTLIGLGFPLATIPLFLASIVPKYEQELVGSLAMVTLIIGAGLILFGWVAGRRGF